VFLLNKKQKYRRQALISELGGIFLAFSTFFAKKF
jgi:hypothetical protein